MSTEEIRLAGDEGWYHQLRACNSLHHQTPTQLVHVAEFQSSIVNPYIEHVTLDLLNYNTRSPSPNIAETYSSVDQQIPSESLT